jgi:uncharacterized membrane protein YidH (DUF202 family)
MKNKTFLASLFQAISDVINSSERAFLDLLSAIVPYAVPIIPAYLTYYHTLTEMNFPSWVAWTAAFVTEVLGITSVSTAIRFYRHNVRYKDARNHAPFKLAVAVYVAYIVIVLVTNVVLEIVSGVRSGWIIFAIGCFSLLSLPSGVLISIRSQYTGMLEDKQRAKLNLSPTLALAAETQTVKLKYGGDWRVAKKSMSREELDAVANSLTAEQIMATYGVNNRTAFQWKKNAKDAL